MKDTVKDSVKDTVKDAGRSGTIEGWPADRGTT